MLYKKCIIAAAVFGLAACGFEPLYVEKTSGDDLWYYNNKFDTDRINMNVTADKKARLSEKYQASSFCIIQYIFPKVNTVY